MLELKEIEFFLIDGDVEPFLIGISASLFKNAIYEHSLLNGLHSLLLDQLVDQET